MEANTRYNEIYKIQLNGKTIMSGGRFFWYSKSDAEVAFKASSEWFDIKQEIVRNNPDADQTRIIDLCRRKYRDLINSGCLSYPKTICNS